MKILILSDSHRSLEAMERAVRAELPDRIVHLGDHVADADTLHARFPEIPLSSVPGNCDGPCARPYALLEDYEGVTLFMTHGHRFGVKRDLLHLSLAACEAGAQIALYGHTHVQRLDRADELTLLCPGACGAREARYAVLELRAGAFSVRLEGA